MEIEGALPTRSANFYPSRTQGSILKIFAHNFFTPRTPGSCIMNNHVLHYADTRNTRNNMIHRAWITKYSSEQKPVSVTVRLRDRVHELLVLLRNIQEHEPEFKYERTTVTVGHNQERGTYVRIRCSWPCTQAGFESYIQLLHPELIVQEILEHETN